MKAILGGVIISVGLLVLPGMAAAAPDKGTPDEAVAMVQKAAALIRSAGKEKAFAAITDPANKDFHDRDLYVYVYDMNGVAVAHGNNPKMTGKNLLDLKDSEGKAMVREFLETAKTKGKGWVEYKWPNPVTKAVDKKSGYVEKVDDVVVGSGVYR
jgi:signal transduction histidine kinase